VQRHPCMLSRPLASPTLCLCTKLPAQHADARVDALLQGSKGSHDMPLDCLLSRCSCQVPQRQLRQLIVQQADVCCHSRHCLQAGSKQARVQLAVRGCMTVAIIVWHRQQHRRHMEMEKQSNAPSVQSVGWMTANN